MSNSKFTAKTYGKWILAGEHSVLRGKPALVFPIRSCALTMSYTNSEKPLSVVFLGEQAGDLKLLYWGVLEAALNNSGHQRGELKGEVEITSNLPLGAGLGASAALCVSVGKLWQSFGWIEESELYEFSRQLENLFHGESSGVDIAAAMSDEGLKFYRGGDRLPLDMNWQPEWYLSYSGEKGVTSECIKKVKALIEKSPDLAEKIDRQMAAAAENAESALKMDQVSGRQALASAIDQARDCFHQWGLDEGALETHMKDLVRKGALAVKPTGSGGGGYVLSLWRETPPNELLQSELLPL